MKRHLFSELKEGIESLQAEREGRATHKVTAFDAAAYLTDEETIDNYLKSAEESGDPKVVRQAEIDVAAARARLAK